MSARLAQHPAIRDAAVVATDDGKGNKQLLAYVAPIEGARPSREELRRFLVEALPEYMAPEATVLVDELPRTPHGKLDRRLLPQPGPSDICSAEGFVAPRTSTEKALAEIWRELLDVEKVGVHDNFFEIGGHSLLAVTVAARTEAVLGKQVAITSLLHAPTVKQLAALLDAEHTRIKRSSLVPLQAEGSKPPFYCVHSNSGQVFLYRELASNMGPDRPFYGLQAPGIDGEATPLITVEAMASRYIQEIRTIQKNGPYYLGGFCLGAYVALEMAHQLRAQGESVPLLVSFSTDGGWKRVASARDSVGYHLGYLAQMPWRARWHYLAERSGYRLMRLRAASLAAAARLLVALERPLPDLLRNNYVEEIHRRASRDYTPHSFDGRFLYIHGTEESHRDPRPYWGEVVTGGIQTRAVPGGFLSIFHEPYVKTVAESLRAYLDEAQSGSRN